MHPSAAWSDKQDDKTSSSQLSSVPVFFQLESAALCSLPTKPYSWLHVQFGDDSVTREVVGVRQDRLDAPPGLLEVLGRSSHATLASAAPVCASTIRPRTA